MKHELLHYV